MSRTRRYDPNHEPEDMEDFDHAARRAPMQDDAWGPPAEVVEEDEDLDLVDLFESRLAHRPWRTL